MDKIWYENPLKSKVIGPCGGDEKTWMTMQNRLKSLYRFYAMESVKNEYISEVEGTQRATQFWYCSNLY